MSNANPQAGHCACGKHHAGEISHQQMLTELRNNPTSLATLLAGLSAAELDQPGSNGSWSIKHIVDHLCESLLSYLMDFQRMLDESRPVIVDVVIPSYDHDNISAMLALYAASEAKLADMLASLSDEQWQRRAIIGWPGGSGELIFDDYAVHAVDHDREHLAEISKLRESL